jgi:hypothetical protein
MGSLIIALVSAVLACDPEVLLRQKLAMEEQWPSADTCPARLQAWRDAYRRVTLAYLRAENAQFVQIK